MTETPIVGRPVDRRAIIEKDDGFLVTCGDWKCEWQGWFPDQDLAKAAINNHIRREKRQGEDHFGQVSAHLVTILEDDRAICVTDSVWQLKGEDFPIEFEPETWQEDILKNVTPKSESTLETNRKGVVPTFPIQASGDPGVNEVAERGDVIDKGYQEVKIWQIIETRSLGLPTWSIISVPVEYDGWPESKRARRQNCLYNNELIVRNGFVTCRYTEEPILITGSTEHQATIDTWGSA